MARQPRIGDEIQQLKGLLAGLSLDTKLLRLEQVLRRKDWSEQPRAPAGQPNGGQWVGDGGGSGGTVDPDVLRLVRPQWAQMPVAEPAQSREETRLDDGTRVLSIRIRAGRRDFDEQHTVTAPDGESRVFETLGATQTIRDGVSGEILGRSTFTANGAEPDATVQPAFLPAVPLALAAVRILRTLELAGTLFATLSAQRGRYGTVLGTTAHEFRGAEDFRHMPAIWVGPLDQASLDAACPKTGEIQTQLDAVAAAVRGSGVYRTPQAIGTAIHVLMDRWAKAQDIANFKSELSILKNGDEGTYGQSGTSRLDQYHRPQPAVACVYDYKTGLRGLSWSEWVRYATRSKTYFPATQRIIVIQMRESR
ncbi:hypothetical protein FV222_14995 [Methylobacterium sp. WL103]|nr:hypothetical protein FV222_14995 [Methylobacterium sp. WL103]